jgi:hypothetical protein
MPLQPIEKITQRTLEEDFRLAVPLRELGIPKLSALIDDDIIYVGEAIIRSEVEILRTPNFGRPSFYKFKQELTDLGLSLGTEVDDSLLENGQCIRKSEIRAILQGREEKSIDAYRDEMANRVPSVAPSTAVNIVNEAIDKGTEAVFRRAGQALVKMAGELPLPSDDRPQISGDVDGTLTQVAEQIHESRLSAHQGAAQLIKQIGERLAHPGFRNALKSEIKRYHRLKPGGKTPA